MIATASATPAIAAARVRAESASSNIRHSDLGRLARDLVASLVSRGSEGRHDPGRHGNIERTWPEASSSRGCMSRKSRVNRGCPSRLGASRPACGRRAVYSRSPAGRITGSERRRSQVASTKNCSARLPMPAEPKGFTLFPHDWHSTDYVAEWIERDASRDPERRPLLQRMLSFVPWPRDAELTVL